jgi:uncharacterized protein (DUF1800 family)
MISGLARAPFAWILALAGASGASLPPPSAADDARIVHALQRLSYGVRPGDVDAVRRVGLPAWLDSQLHPERLRDTALEARLAGLRTVGLDTAELRKGYEVPASVKKEYKERLGENPSEADEKRLKRELVREMAPMMEGRPQEVIDELQEAKLLRAVYSARQLNEVLVDFWLNHFNVYAGKSLDRYLVSEYERDAIRPHAFGRFEDLLRATAESPAMLFYLDNWLSSDPNAERPSPRGRFTAMRPGREGAGADKKRGLNENYARELLELHTLGVDSGYTQKDVTEVARCFTGWTVRGLRGRTERVGEDPEFVFVPWLHDPGDKVVLGQRIKGGGRDEGEKVLHMLASSPATARFVSTKLARRFVADEPPPALVERAAERFRATDGDIREVVRTIVTSPEFGAAEARAAKVKTPLEFVASALRATNADISDARESARRLAEMGMPLYMQQPPTGYKDVAEAWVSTSGLLARLNFALDLAGNRLPGVRVDARALAPAAADSAALADAYAALFVPAGLSDATRRTIEQQAGGGLDAARIAGLVLGSPEFQRK